MLRPLAGIVLMCLPLACAAPGGAVRTSGLSPCDERSATAPPPADGCGLVCRAEIPVSFEGASPIAQVWVNDHPARMLVDTGAAVTILDSAALPRLGIGPATPIPGDLVGIGGAQPRGTVVLGKLAVSYVHREKLPVSVITITRTPGLDPPDGVLGNDVWHDYEVDLDLPHDLIRLYQGRPCAGALPGWAREDGTLPFPALGAGHHVIVPVALDGRPTQAMLDSGAEGIVVNRKLALAFGVAADDLSGDLGTRLIGIGPNQVVGNLHQFGALDVAGQHLTSVETSVVALPFAVPGMILGEDYLRTHKVWISYATGQVHFAHTW